MIINKLEKQNMSINKKQSNAEQDISTKTQNTSLSKLYNKQQLSNQALFEFLKSNNKEVCFYYDMLHKPLKNSIVAKEFLVHIIFYN